MKRGKLLYFPSEGNRGTDFIALKNPSCSVEFEPANRGCNGKHATIRQQRATNDLLKQEELSLGRHVTRATFRLIVSAK
jgi:hypothetical protein